MSKTIQCVHCQRGIPNCAINAVRAVCWLCCYVGATVTRGPQNTVLLYARSADYQCRPDGSHWPAKFVDGRLPC